MGRVAQFGVYVEIVGTFGIAVILAIHGFHHGLGYLFTHPGQTHAATNPLGAELPRQLAGGCADRGAGAGVHLLRLRVGRRHLRGDQGRRPPGAAGDAPGRDLGRHRVHRAHRRAAAGHPGRRHQGRRATRSAAASPSSSASCPSGVQDFLLLMIIFAFFSCGTSIQGAGSRLAFSYARDEALPGVVVDLAGAPAVRDPGQRADRRCGDHRAVRAAGLRLARRATSTSCSSPTRATSTRSSRSSRSGSAASTCRS